jgi:hypothetical protein
MIHRQSDLWRFLGKPTAQEHEALMSLALIGDTCELENTVEFMQKKIAREMQKEPSTISGYLKLLQKLFDRYFADCCGLACEPFFERARGNHPVVTSRGKAAYRLAQAYRDLFSGQPAARSSWKA